jgi:hypothetical protein
MTAFVAGWCLSQSLAMRTRGGPLLVVFVGPISAACVGAAPVGAAQSDPAIEGRAPGFSTFLDVGSPPTTPDTVLPAVVARMAAAQL